MQTAIEHLGARLVVYPTREEWATDFKKSHPEYRIGGTTAAAILGVGFKSPWDVYEAARGRGDETEDNAVLQRGRRYEPVALAQYAEARGLDVWAPLSRTIHAEHEWLAPSPDAFVAEKGVVGLAEIKTAVSGDAWGEDGTVIPRWEDGAEALVPSGYAVQAYIQMECAGVPWCDFVVGLPDRIEFMKLRVIRLMADHGTQAELVEAVRAWREKHLVGGEAPPIDGTDACRSALVRRFESASKVIRQAFRQGEPELIQEYLRLSAEAKRIDYEKLCVGNQLLEAIGKDYGLVFEGVGKVLAVRVGGRTTYRVADLLADHPEFEPVFAGYVRQGEPHVQLRGSAK